MNNPQFIQHLSEEQILVSRLEELYQWSQTSAIWPIGFGLACCGVEMVSAYLNHFELDSNNSFPKYPPNEANVMIIAGTITFKIVARIKAVYEQLLSPKYVISMGSCANIGGPYWEYGYHVLKGVNQIIPVDVFVPGCPPRPQTIVSGIVELYKKVKNGR